MATQATALTALETQIAEIQATQSEHGETMRAIRSDIARIIEILTPTAADGPTLDDILAQLVVQLGEQGVVLRRIDGRTVEIKTLVGGLDEYEEQEGQDPATGVVGTHVRANGKDPRA